MSRFFQSISNLGISPETPADEAKRIRAVNRLSLLLGILAGIYCIPMAFTGLWFPFRFAVGAVLLAFLAPTTNWLGRTGLAKAFFLAKLYALFTALTWVFGRQANVEFMVLYLPAVALLIYQRIDFWKHIALSSSFFLACKIIVHTTQPIIVPHFPWLWEGFIGLVHCIGFFSMVYLIRAEAALSEKINFEKNQKLAAALAEQEKSQERLKLLNRELQQFASLASHDMKEPLRTIHSFSQLLARRMPPDDRSANEFLAFIKDAAQRMASLLDDLINYARAGVPKGEIEPIDLHETLKKVENNLFSLIAQKKATIRMENPLPKIVAHETLFVQLFQNLITNGIKFQRPDSMPIVTIFSRKTTDGELQIGFRDNGIGIAEEFHEQIFEPFRRLHTRAEFDGSGIGLATCLKIVQFYEGQMRVSSVVGEGTEFLVCLPIQILG